MSDEAIVRKQLGKCLEGRTVRVLVEIPEKWIDPESPDLMITWAVRQEVNRQIRELLEREYIKKVKIPSPKEITAEEVKDRMITLLAQKALEEPTNE